MAWKGVHISKPARLSYKDRQLCVVQEDGNVNMPLEDVAWIVLDSNHSTLYSGRLWPGAYHCEVGKETTA